MDSEKLWKFIAMSIALTVLASAGAQNTAAAGSAPSGANRQNLALASNGATALASSTFSAGFAAQTAINGDRTGGSWGTTGGWIDDTNSQWPDWLEVDFAAAAPIDEVDVFSVQDTWWEPATPTLSQTFTQYGLTDFVVQYWDGGAWVSVPNGTVSGNQQVWRQLGFAPVTTTKVRVMITGALAQSSRIAEIEAWGSLTDPAPPTTSPTTQNVALASNGATALASSTFSAGFAAQTAINGDRSGASWGTTGGWVDATNSQWPDWLEVDFAAAALIGEVDVFSVQDVYWAPATPTLSQTFTQYGLTDFIVQYWDGGAWVSVPSGTVSGNQQVWRQLGFAPVTTTKIRVMITGALAQSSRIAEIEAWGSLTGPTPTLPTSQNVALASSGATALASSTYSAGFAAQTAINGDRSGGSWGTTGGWVDGTNNQWPDWLEVDFAAADPIDEVDVFSVQDAWWAPATPTLSQTFTQYGLTDFIVQYWDGGAWASVQNGTVSGNRQTWRQFRFAPITTTKVRVMITGALAQSSRITEIEAWGTLMAPPPDTAGPTLTDLQPWDGSSVSGPVTVSVNAADPSGLAGVQFWIDGAPLGGEDMTPPYAVTWNSSDVANGSHILTVTARDGGGHQTTAHASVAVSNSAGAPPIPELTNWQTQMTSFGGMHCNQGSISSAIGSGGLNSEDNVWYYDGTKVYQHIARYTGDPGWYTCAQYTNDAYKGWVLALTNGLTSSTSALGSWRVFPEGLANDYWRTGDPSSKEAAIRLAKYSAYAPYGGESACGYSRETAYTLNAYLVAEELGEPRHPAFDTAVDNALAHLRKSFVTNECAVVPFMMGLTMESLIHYYERTADPRVPPAIEAAADGLWTRFWLPSSEAFAYDSANPTLEAPDLNMLIAPAYAWLWQLTGAQRHLDRGDQIFAGGVRRAYLFAGKAFSQNYRSSFDYVKWRSQPSGQIRPITRY